LLNVKKYFEPGALFSYRNFRRIWLSNLLVTIGSGAFPMAIAIVIIDAGGDATTLGLILAARMLSGTALTLVGGVWADRIKRKYVMISADLGRAFLLLILVFVSAPDIPRVYMALLVFLVGIGDAFGAPAAAAIMNVIVPDHVLQEANVIRGITSRLGQIIGPAIGGIVIALVGARLTFILTALTFFLGTVLLIGIKEEAVANPESREPFIHELKEGIRTVREMPWVGAMILMATFQLMVVFSAETILLPIITKREFQTNAILAAASATFAIGATVASLWFLKLKPKYPGKVSLAVWSLFALMPIALAFPVSPTFIIFVYLIAGISVGPWDAYWPIALQREVPKEKLGRVFAIDHAGSAGMIPLGMALVGPVTELVGERNFLLFAAAFHILINILVYRVPGVKELRSPTISAKSEQD
jgi:MFS family permease